MSKVEKSIFGIRRISAEIKAKPSQKGIIRPTLRSKNSLSPTKKSLLIESTLTVDLVSESGEICASVLIESCCQFEFATPLSEENIHSPEKLEQFITPVYLRMAQRVEWIFADMGVTMHLPIVFPFDLQQDQLASSRSEPLAQRA